MAELTVSVRMPKFESTEAAHRQRQDWHGAARLVPSSAPLSASLAPFFVGTIIWPAGYLASWLIGKRARVIWPAGSWASGQARRLAMASGLARRLALASGQARRLAMASVRIRATMSSELLDKLEFEPRPFVNDVP